FSSFLPGARQEHGIMSSRDDLNLAGVGSAYIRVSDDRQDTKRQYAAIEEFQRRHDVKIALQYFKDEGWARDTADVRPALQRLMKLVEGGQVKWILVDKLDRFGTKDPHQLMYYLYRLREAGCKLYEGQTSTEWTGEDFSTIISAVMEGEKSKKEP